MRGLFLLVFFLWPLEAEDFCALRVRVVNSNGVPAHIVRITLLNEAGGADFDSLVEGGDVRICDFSFGAHTLRVGSNECLPSTVENIRLVFGRPLDLKVVQNSCSYRISGRMGCFIYVRVTDERKVPLADTAIRGLSPAEGAKTDGYGRFQGLFSDEREVELSHEGYQTKRVPVSCKSDEEVNLGVALERLK